MKPNFIYFPLPLQNWIGGKTIYYRVLKSISEVDYTLYSDASTKGWGHLMSTISKMAVGQSGKLKLHITVIELTATKLAIFSLLPLQVGIKHLRVMTHDNTAMSYINSKEGVRPMLCNNVTTEIWWGLHISCTQARERKYYSRSSIRRISRFS